MNILKIRKYGIYCNKNINKNLIIMAKRKKKNCFDRKST